MTSHQNLRSTSTCSTIRLSTNRRQKPLTNKLCDVKDILLADLEKVLERGEKLDVLIIKSGELETRSKVFKKNAKKVNTTTKRRRCCYIFWGIVILILVLAGIAVLLKFLYF